MKSLLQPCALIKLSGVICHSTGNDSFERRCTFRTKGYDVTWCRRKVPNVRSFRKLSEQYNIDEKRAYWLSILYWSIICACYHSWLLFQYFATTILGCIIAGDFKLKPWAINTYRIFNSIRKLLIYVDYRIIFYEIWLTVKIKLKPMFQN